MLHMHTAHTAHTIAHSEFTLSKVLPLVIYRTAVPQIAGPTNYIVLHAKLIKGFGDGEGNLRGKREKKKLGTQTSCIMF